MDIRRQLRRLGVTAVVLVLAATLVPRGATAQETARGQVDYAEVVGGPTDVIMVRVRLEPGASQGWHTHPGPVWVVVTSGEVSAYRDDGCSRAYTPGEAFLEQPGRPIDLRNAGLQPAEFAVTQILLAGGPGRVNVDAPTAVCGREAR